MSQLSSQLVLRLTDGVSGPARRVVQSMHGITAAAKTTAVTATNAVNGASRALVSIASGIGMYKAHESILKFATATNKLAAANPDFKLEDIREVQKLAREISRATLFDPGTVMDAANSLARADVNLQAIKGTLKPLAIAAMAADVPVNQLADSFVKLASNFGLPMKTRKEAAETFAFLGDLATYVGQRAPGSFDDYVQAMKQVGAAARSAGIDIRWLSGAYIELDKAGIRNEEAGTALRSLVKHLTQPTLEARRMYAQLGIDPATFLKGGKKANADQLVAAFQSEYGKELTKVAPKIQNVLDSSLSTKDRGNALMKIIEAQWGGKMKPVDARKVKKTVDNFLFSGTEKIDPQAWLDELSKKGVTLGQFLRLVEPKQASRLINLLNEKFGEEEAKKKLNQPLSALPGFRPGLAEEAGDKMMQGYPAAIKRIGDAFQSLIESLDKAGVIDAFAKSLKAIGDAVVAISQGTAGFKEWVIGLATATPVVAALIAPLAKLTGVLAQVGASIAQLTGLTPMLLALTASFSGLAAAIAAVAAPFILRSATADDRGTTSGERMKKHRGGRTMKQTLRDEFNDERARQGIPQIDSIWTKGTAPLEHLDVSSQAASAGQRTGEAYRDAVNEALQGVDRLIDAAVQRWIGKLGFSVSPSITPKVTDPPAQKTGSLEGIAAKQHATFADYGFNTA